MMAFFNQPRRTRRILPLCSSFIASYLLLFLLNNAQRTQAASDDAKTATIQTQGAKDFRWPNGQFNVLVDLRSINETERQILAAFFDQLEHRTCVKVRRLNASLINPFDTRHLAEDERNFVYIFRGQFNLASRMTSSINSNNQAATLGLSTLGCLRQGRQSMVLTDLAFAWPELVLRYHVLRALGVRSLTKPEVESALKQRALLPLSQKIERQQELRADQPATYYVYGHESGARGSGKVRAVQYLDERDLSQVKELYNCSAFQNRLSAKPLSGEQLPDSEQNNSSKIIDANSASGSATPPDDTEPSGQPALVTGELAPTEAALGGAASEGYDAPDADSGAGEQTSDDGGRKRRLDDDPAPAIASQLLSSDQPDEPTTAASGASSPPPADNGATPTPRAANGGAGEQRPMMMQLDEFHAQDPQFQQANQMKLSQVSNDSLASYRLMEPPAPSQETPSLELQPPPQQNYLAPIGGPKSEVLISFEQAPSSAASTGPQLLKLCSCTCQTMTAQQQQPSATPKPPATQPPPTSTSWPPVTTTSERPPPSPSQHTTTTQASTTFPTWDPIATELPVPPTSQQPPASTAQSNQTSKSTRKPTTSAEWPPDTWPLPVATSSTQAPPATQATTATPRPASSTPEVPPATTTNSSSAAPLTENACDQVQWVKPNKSVYSSARIVWDVDRANQNYFICANPLNNQLVPGKTHGFSCVVSDEGKAYELHNFSVLTKPESVSLAWVQRSSDSLGKTNLVVIGGHSKERDPYAVARCLVRDENNDVLTLIGYVNSHGNGWFPFDDIQIECAQYDVLACVA